MNERRKSLSLVLLLLYFGVVVDYDYTTCREQKKYQTLRRDVGRNGENVMKN
jgi:hypothetical protein